MQTPFQFSKGGTNAMLNKINRAIALNVIKFLKDPDSGFRSRSREKSWTQVCIDESVHVV